MKTILSSPIFIGGVIPAVLFGVYNFLYKPASQALPLSHLIIGIALGGIITALCFDLLTEKALLKTPLSGYSLYSLGLGVLWGGALIAMAWAFAHMGGNASQIFPIVNTNSLLTVLLVLLILPEPVVVWKVLVGSGLIVLGSWFLT